jgi:hypothetical protein
MQVFVKFPESSYNKITINDGLLVVNEEIRGEIDLVYEPSRCSLDLKTCEKLQTIQIRNMCKNIQDKTTFYYSTLQKISPRLECPVKPGNYTATELVTDLSIMSLFSIDGYTWIFRVRLISNEGRSKVKKGILCFDIELKTTKTRIRS